jgi:para-aminobenzoate synthetase / 4-amino-4-deoxychorismate lyase
MAAVPDPRHGIFETLLIIDGRPVELEAHLERLSASLAELFPDRTPPLLAEEARTRSACLDMGSLRVAVAPTVGDFDLEFELRTPQVGAFLPISGSNAPTAVVDLRAIALDGGLGCHKWVDRSLLDETQAKLPLDSLPLIVDTDGAVLEASRANLFAVCDGTLCTPPLDGRILPGITRMRTLELAASVGMKTREITLSRVDLLDADEVFLTGSVRGIERVRAIDGKALAADGEIASGLAAELRRAWFGTPVG